MEALRTLIIVIIIAGFFVYFSTKCAFPMNAGRYSACAKMRLFYYLLLLDKNEILDIIKFINQFKLILPKEK